jgi:hypothetical protein
MIMRNQDLIRAILQPPDWLNKAWKDAKERALDELSADDIDAEIEAYRREKAN